jgi:hypothetical protein
MPKNNRRLIYFTSISAIAYIVLGYFTTRESTSTLFFLYLSLCAAFIAAWHTAGESTVKKYIYIGIGLRLLFMFTTPFLSDDVYRFIWDGRLLINGISPFAALPIDYITNPSALPGIEESLYKLLNSPAYFTVYPPLAQLVFWLSALLSPQSTFGSILVMRLLIILSEVGSIMLMTKLLCYYKLPAKNILLYALNPLVIIELTSSLHFEAFVIYFLLLALYFLHKHKVVFSGICWSIAVGFKLIPLIFLPLLIRRLSVKKQVILFVTTGVFTILLFMPLYDEALVNGLSTSLTLYFQTFEFNASIYYLARTVGYWIQGYNIIAVLGPGLAVATFVAILAYSLLGKQNTKRLPEAMMFVLLIYLSFATIIHPWYITTLIALSVFTTYRFATLWSFLIFVTYSGYTSSGYTEPIYLIAFEYIALASFLVYEIYSNSKTNATNPAL